MFDFIELYSDPRHVYNPKELAVLKGIPVTVHATHSGGFHTFVIGEEEQGVWAQVLAIADFFQSPTIVLHPGRDHTLETFRVNLALIDDPRIIIENMAGVDLEGHPMFGQKLSDLTEIRKTKQICFDFEKAVKAAHYQQLEYKTYITEVLEKLSPTYFHVSGGNSKDPMDQHTDLFDSDIDFAWIKRQLEALPETRLVFETPKRNGLANDRRNMQYFRSL
jgi:sugar phosphate isomerase/epimerase